MNKRVVLSGILLLIVTVLSFLLLPKLLKKQLPSRVVYPTINPTPKPRVNMAKAYITIEITDKGFNPATVEIKRLTLIRWINRSGKVVNISSDGHPEHKKFPTLNRGDIEVDAKTEYLVTDTGTLTYHNHLNPSQKGTLIVTE